MDYDTMTKEALQDEIKKRRSEGRKISVDLRKPEADLIKALEADDEAGITNSGDTDGSFENQIPLQPEMPSQATQPSDDIFAKGFRAKNKNDGLTYQVVKVETDETRPYKARIPKQASGHPGLFWEGSEAEYRDVFTKV